MGEVVHGLRNTYLLKGCRCRPCKDAACTYEKERRRKVKLSPDEAVMRVIRQGVHTRDAIKEALHMRNWDDLMDTLTEMWEDGVLVIKNSEYFEKAA